MNQLSDIFIAGFSISFIVAGLNGVAFLYFLWTTSEAIRAQNKEEVKAKRSKFIWVFMIAWLTSIGMGLMYLVQYYGEGMALTPSALFIVTWRWLFIALIGALYMGFVSCVLSPGKHHPAQSLFSILLWLAAFVCLYQASKSESESPRIVWATFYILFISMDVVCLFFPDSLLFYHYQEVRDIIYSEPSVWGLMFRPLKPKSREASIKLWAFVLPLLLLAQIVVAFLGYTITWFLSDGNEFTAVANFRQTNLSYLVFDMILLVPHWLVVSCLTFQHYVKKVTIIDTHTGHKTINTKYGIEPPFH